MRQKKKSSHNFQPAAAVHSSLGSHVYHFTNGAASLDSSSEEEIDITELRARGGERPHRNASREKVGDIVLLERAVTEDDNLNKLALQYGCKVADIKRVNNFLTEQDMYALKTIKIPVKVHGILTEQHGELSIQNFRSADSLDIVIESPDEAPVSSTSSRDISRYFHNIDKNIEAAAQKQDLPGDLFDPSMDGLQAPLIPSQKDAHPGSDWGIRWWNAVLIMLLIGVVLPVFYIIYYEKLGASEKSSHSANLTGGLLNRSTPG
ncbi:lysM and putative peptidoglycan-binding domain-containing protein 4 [Gastrophryne carolinensis]